LKERPQECTWDKGIDWAGLNEEDQKRIQEIGLEKWLEETAVKQEQTKKKRGGK
jgi:hypothetical protein